MTSSATGNNNSKEHPLHNVAILSRVIPFIATSSKRLVHLSFTTSIFSDCIANYSKATWHELFTRLEPRTAERLAMRSCNLGLFEIARVVAGNPSAAQLRDSSGWSCFHQASFCGRPGTCTLLLQVNETEVNALTNNGWTPVRCAIYNSKESVSVIRVLLRDSRTNVNIPCNEGDTPLIACVAAGNISRLEMMEAIILSASSSSTTSKSLFTQDQIVNYQNNKNGFSALFVALKNRDSAAVELLLKHGAKLDLKDKWGRTPLMFVAGAPEAVSLPMVKLLLEKGAKIFNHYDDDGDDDARESFRKFAKEGNTTDEEARRKFLNFDSKGNSVFDLARSPIVKLLLEQGAQNELGKII